MALRRLRGVAAPIAFASLGIGAAIACRGVRVAEPPYGQHPRIKGEATCVPDAPPGALLEEVPPRPGPYHVWIDGEWRWSDPSAATRARWTWKKGGWVLPSPLSTYARPLVLRLANGALAYVPGHWHDERDEKAPKLAASVELASCPLIDAASGSDGNEMVDAAIDAKDGGG